MADNGKNNIADDACEAGIALAREKLEDRILEAALRELSPEDIRFATDAAATHARP